MVSLLLMNDVFTATAQPQAQLLIRLNGGIAEQALAHLDPNTTCEGTHS
jgi:hypothetical protein